MKKICLTITFLVNSLFATEVAVCTFRTNALSGFADDTIICSGDFKKRTTIQELYKQQ